MSDRELKAVAVVGLGSIMPDAPNTATFWQNLMNSKYSINDVDPTRWDPELYYDPDPKAPDKTYSRIGGWVRDWEWEPLKWRLPIPPKVSDAMDLAQKWSIVCARELLADYGYPERPLNTERTGVILGNALGGDLHLMTAGRALFPEFYQNLLKAPSFLGLSSDMQKKIFQEFMEGVDNHFLGITEDTMPGELSNIVPGRVAALFNFNGPNYATDAACASAMAAFAAAIDGLVSHEYDAVITGGVDANNGVSTFVKFCKIGALSATGSRPYAEGADGFVMGEGSALFLLKRVEDAERDGDKIYAIIRALGASSDGKGKGITAPNPVGQRYAVERAWQNAGVSPTTATMIEGHGTSTAVGDLVEAKALNDFFKGVGSQNQSIALGSVKSNVGHLKAAAGAAGMLKAVLSLHHQMIPESLNFQKPNPGLDFTQAPFYVPTKTMPWEATQDGVRRAGVSAFGFGGTNFHAVLEEYIPGRVSSEMKARKASVVVNGSGGAPTQRGEAKTPLRGALVIGDQSKAAIATRLEAVLADAKNGKIPEKKAPAEKDLRASMRLAIDFENADDLVKKGQRALKALNSDNDAMWRAMRAKGIFFGQGSPGKIAFLYTGQGSQYINMIEDLRDADPLVGDLFKRADEVMTPLLGKPLSKYIFADKSDTAAMAAAENDLKQTAITQPAVLTVDTSLSRMLKSYGIKPDMVMGHSLGEYGALVGANALPFEDALKAVSARGKGMTDFSVEDNGMMAAVMGPLEKVKKILETVEGYVVIANINSLSQCVIGGATDAVQQAIKAMQDAGFTAQQIPVSHAFHTKIVTPASEPLVQTLENLHFKSPEIPLIANVTGEQYPMGDDVVPQMLDILKEQVSAPVQFVKGLNTLYDAGVRIFVEVGPKRVLHGFVEDVLKDKADAVSFYTNHPRVGGIASFNIALCGLYAEGLGDAQPEEQVVTPQPAAPQNFAQAPAMQPTAQPVAPAPVTQTVQQPATPVAMPTGSDQYSQLGKMFVDFIEKGFELYSGGKAPSGGAPQQTGHVVISGASLGLPGNQRVFDDENIARILRGEQFIQQIPVQLREEMVKRNIHRLVKSEAGGPRFESISDVKDVLKLAGRQGEFDLVDDFGFPADRMVALDTVTALAIAAGIDALRDAGIPMVMKYKTTTKGTQLPDRWQLPESLRDETGIIFASAFPGTDSLIEEVEGNQRDISRRTRLAELQAIRSRLDGVNGTLAAEIDARIQALQEEIAEDPYIFDRRFLFRVLSMGHSQFAEYIGARGPNTQINAACASTTQAVSLAQDWILAGRCSRVVILAADNITSDTSLGWFGAGFLASGAAATEDVVEEVALPFDRRRHGMIVGMGGAALVVETPEKVSERGMQPIAQVLSTVTANSAFHGTRLDVDHICQVMENLVSQAERDWGVNRAQIAPHTVFVSHETYTPARGGSAAAEINALRRVFGPVADQIVISNTKGYTGHAMATGIEDVLAVKALETGIVPPVPNFKEIDPELGQLNISKGGNYPVTYALRLGAGFGSQISMSLIQWLPMPDGQRRSPQQLGYAYRIVDQAAWKNWLHRITGNGAAGVEVYKRTLRVKDAGAARMPEAKPVAPAKPKPAPTPIIASSPSAAPATPGAPTPAPAAAPATPAPAIATDAVKDRVLQVIAKQTGYPVDMLDMELDLEADLGIDTVKQAEMFAAVREEYNIERDDDLQLRDFNTIERVIGFVYDKRPELKQAAAAPAPVTQTPAAPVASAPEAAPADEGVKSKVLQLIADQTGYPIDMLDLELDLEADLGIDTVKQAEMFAAVREEYNIERDDDLQLRDFNTIERVIGFVYDKRPELKQATAAPAPVAQTAAAPVASAPVAAPADNGVKTRVLQLIADQTGYPIDMLDMELDLEADLGIDTVKQAEMFAAVREEYGIERDDDLQLRDFNTIERVIGFVYDKRPDLKQTAAAPAPVAQTPAAPVASVPVAAPADDGVKSKVLQLIADQTGYPIDMLDLELDLEADLGIDTVKQAEMFAAVREEYNIERDDDLQLRDFNTIERVIGFVYDKRPDLKQTAAAPAPVAQTPAAPVASVPVAAPADDGVKSKVLQLIADQTGYPIDMLDLELDLEADLGIDTVKQAEMFAAVREEYGIERDDDLQLRDFNTIERVIGFVYDKRPDLKQTAAAPASVAQTPTASAAPAPVAASGDEGVKSKVLQLIADQTGYPIDMLDLELDLEADLGIDTVKQAEMFAAVREEYSIERDDDLQLRDFNTIERVIGFVYSKRPDLNQAAPASKQVPAPVVDGRASSDYKPDVKFEAAIKGDMEATKTIARRVPTPMLRPEIDLCKATGVELDENSRVIVHTDQGGVGKALIKKLEKKGVKVLLIDDAPDGDTLEKRIQAWLEEGAISGVYWLPALDAEKAITEMSLADWKAATHLRVKMLYTTMRTLYDTVGGAGTFLVSATRLGGQHGYDENGALNPLGGPVVGFTKAFKREKPEALVKAIDFEASRKTSAYADLLIAETVSDPGVVEVGYKNANRWTIGLQEKRLSDEPDGMTLNQDSVFLVTGAAGSITSAIVADLAEASGGTFYLLDLAPKPDAGNADIQKFATDKDGLKRDIFERLKAKGERATPAVVEKVIAGIEREHAALAAIQAVEAAGGKANYHSLNLLDEKAVADVMQYIAKENGKIDVLLHAGGLEISRLLPDKGPSEFDLVFDVKSDGWFNMLSNLGDIPLGAAVVFSSIAGRFGNGGQTDYSAANDLLCKSVSSFKNARPETRGIATDWTAWGGIGMAVRGSIPTVMKAAGIDMLPPEAGISFIRRELTCATKGAEIVVAGSLGIMMKEFDENGGLDNEKVAAKLKEKGIMTGAVKRAGLFEGLTIESSFVPKDQGFLEDHRIGGTPVLPGVMGIEAMVEAAKILFPERYVAVVENVEFDSPFKFYRDQERTVNVRAFFEIEGDDIIANCRLEGVRQLHGQADAQITTHFRSRIRLVSEQPDSVKGMGVGKTGKNAVTKDDIYKLYFHGPAYQVMEKAWKTGERVIGEFATDLPANHTPEDRITLADPRLIELCFQTAGIWEMGDKDRMGLPYRITSVKLVKSAANVKAKLYAAVTANDDGSYDADIIDGKGQVYLQLQGYSTMALPEAIDGELLKPLKEVVA